MFGSATSEKHRGRSTGVEACTKRCTDECAAGQDVFFRYEDDGQSVLSRDSATGAVGPMGMSYIGVISRLRNKSGLHRACEFGRWSIIVQSWCT